MMLLQEFKMSVAESLLLEGKNPVASAIATEFTKKKKRSPTTKSIPEDVIRTDSYNHFPVMGKEFRRYRVNGFLIYTHIISTIYRIKG
ncbi:hypothetical protein E2C01_000952 [Portunus trituberculatus]|uniref:Uncharacterized protein n=1 Tax=Portunus trituberculatus TaxID=210409 RepID=A0A5B7CIZ6_PORTR|nr:hypothetical protein [Portunus trituberculatus]